VTTLTLKRFFYSPTQGTLGSLHLGDYWWWTLEEIWNNNQRGASCIPVGTYQLKRHIHQGRYPAYQLVGVPGRTGINIHYGNTILDVEGCILPGRRHGVVDNMWAVTGSKNAFEEFMQMMEHVEDPWIAIGNVAPVAGVNPP